MAHCQACQIVVEQAYFRLDRIQVLAGGFAEIPRNPGLRVAAPDDAHAHWRKLCQAASAGVETGEWDSREEWNEAKPGWDWLFPFVDKNKDGKITFAEHTEFQEYKKQRPDWQKRVRAELAQ